jgi:hypothetical protein
MKNVLLLLITILALQACNTSKIALRKQQYDKATRLAIAKLKKNKNNEKQILILEEAFNKANKEDETTIAILKSQNYAPNSEKLLNLYSAINQRQILVQQLMPLTHPKTGKNISLYIIPIDDNIIVEKNNTIQFNFDAAANLMSTNSKQDAQKAYSHLQKIKQLEPSYANIDYMLQNAKEKGTTFVNVMVQHNNPQIRSNLQTLWLDIIRTQLANNKWRVYEVNNHIHTNANKSIAIVYDFLDFSPQREVLSEKTETKKIEDGFEWVKSAPDKNSPLDTGKIIQQKKYKTISVNVKIKNMSSKVNMRGRVITYNNNNIIRETPIEQVFNWQNETATYKGDKNALSDDTKRIVNNAFVPFPTQEWMIQQVHQAWSQRAVDAIRQFEQQNN